MPTQEKLTHQLIISIAIVCLGSLQFGYHMAELNSPEAIISCRTSNPGLVPYKDSWFGSHGFAECIPMNPRQVGLVTSVFSIGGLLGSFYVGRIADKLGRKKTTLIHSVFFLIGSTVNAISNNYYTLVLGRFLAGLGAGSAIVITAIFINETSPASYKGFLGSMNQVSINVGILFTQILSLKWSNNNSWRWLLLMGSFIAITNFILIVAYLEESPLWLLNNGFTSQAYRVLHKFRGGEYIHARNEVNSWKKRKATETPEDEELLNNQAEVDEAPVEDNDRAVPLGIYLKSSEFNNSKTVATGILIFQQFCGINSIIFYGVSVLVSIFPKYAIAINCLISLVNAVVTFAAAPLVDSLGRRPLLMTSVTFLGILSAVMGFGIIFTNSILSIVGTFTYITFFAIGLGPIPFLLVGEVTQNKAKALAQSWGTTMNWLATFIVGFLFPILKNSPLGGATYFIFTFNCLLAFLFIKNYIPETKGSHTYEEVWGLRVD